MAEPPPPGSDEPPAPGEDEGPPGIETLDTSASAGATAGLPPVAGYAEQYGADGYDQAAYADYYAYYGYPGYSAGGKHAADPTMQPAVARPSISTGWCQTAVMPDLRIYPFAGPSCSRLPACHCAHCASNVTVWVLLVSAWHCHQLDLC